jgi:type IV pilus assembly protein PilV
MNVGVRMHQRSLEVLPTWLGVGRVRRSLRRQTRPSDGGFSLLEVLIAILVLSFGMLAMVGLQAGALHSNREARLQSSAVRYGRELADLMRGNKAVANKTTESENPYLVGNFQGPAPDVDPPGGCMAASCATPEKVATLQITDWLSRVATELPGTRVVVCFDTKPYDRDGLPQWTCTGPPNGTVAIKIGWTQQTYGRGAVGTSGPLTGLDQASHPSIILQVVPGS